ncbi:MAG: hypothetical protein JO144_13460 [Actinobacteria bacterium]|nr:hypothetical protein [Actinomycetota bacterium]
MRFSGDLEGDLSSLPWHLLQADRSAEERSFDALLDGAPLPPDAPTVSVFLAEVVDALTAAPATGELAGFEQVRAAYATRFATQPRSGATHRRLPAARPARSHPRIATVLTAGLLGLGGFGAAAYAGTLPETAQQVAHHVLGALSSHPDHAGRPSLHPAAPSTGQAAPSAHSAAPSSHPAPSSGPSAPSGQPTAPSSRPAVPASPAPAGQPSSVPSAPAAGPDGRHVATPGHPGKPSHGVPPGSADHPKSKPAAPPSHPAKPSRGDPPPPHGHPAGR